MNHIHLITMTGPEWQRPIEAWHDLAQAQASALALNAASDPKDVFQSLSEYEVIAIPVRDLPSQ